MGGEGAGAEEGTRREERSASAAVLSDGQCG